MCFHTYTDLQTCKNKLNLRPACLPQHLNTRFTKQMGKFFSWSVRKPIQLLLVLWTLALPQQVRACGGLYNSPTDSFSSPLYPNEYPPDQDCIYIITATDGYRITLTFLQFQLQAGTSDCDYDYLQVRDGNSETSPSMGTFCNTSVPGRIRSTLNTMWIMFRSDSSVSGAGFQAAYTTAIIPQKNLLVTNTGLNVIIHIDIETISNYNIPLDGLQSPVAVDFDPPTGRIYWTDVEEKTIRSANLDGSDIQLVRNLEEGSVPDGMSVDSLSRLIFYTDAGYHIIGMITMYGNRHQIVIDSNLDKPRDIELDKHNGVLFWSDWGATPRIERANYDGTGRKTLVSGFKVLYSPSALALDTDGGRLYWTDLQTGTIGWVDVDGRNTSVILQSTGSRFFGMDIYLNDLFVTDWGLTSLQSAKTFIHRISADGSTDIIIATAVGRLNDIRVFAEETEDKEPNGCGSNNGGCSYICIPTPGNRSKCLTEGGESISTETNNQTVETSDRTKTEVISTNTIVIIVPCVVGAVVVGSAVIVAVLIFLRTRKREKKLESSEVFTRRENNFTIPMGPLPGDYSTLAINLDFDEEEHIYQDFRSVHLDNAAQNNGEYLSPVRSLSIVQNHSDYLHRVRTSYENMRTAEQDHVDYIRSVRNSSRRTLAQGNGNYLNAV